MRRGLALTAVLVTGAGTAVGASAGGAAGGEIPVGQAAGAAPLVEQMVVFTDGRARVRRVRARRTTVTVGGRRCAVPGGTPLAALNRSRVARVRLVDYGSCGPRTRDSGGLFVSALGRDRNRGRRGWVYKVGTRLATAGAADPAGAFGAGPLAAGARVLWFYCRLDARTRSCQRSLSLAVGAAGGAVAVRVTGYDDRGEGAPASGATVRAGHGASVTGPDGSARLDLPPGRHRIHAEQPGLVRSFPETVVVP